MLGWPDGELAGGSMGVEIVVRGVHRDCHIHFEDYLTDGIRLGYEPKLHLADACLRFAEGLHELGPTSEIDARPFGFVGRLELSRCLSG